MHASRDGAAASLAAGAPAGGGWLGQTAWGPPATQPAGGSAASILVWLAVLFGGLILLAVVWYVARRNALNPSDAAGTAFTLADLRDLRARGLMTQEEFDRAKAAVVAREMEGMRQARGDRAAADPDEGG